MLTGRCKKDFIKYYMREGIHRTLSPVWLKKIPLSMQWGVIQDFAYSNKIIIETYFITPYKLGFSINYPNDDLKVITGEPFDDFNSCRIAAIEKFNVKMLTLETSFL